MRIDGIIIYVNITFVQRFRDVTCNTLLYDQIQNVIRMLHTTLMERYEITANITSLQNVFVH